MFDRVSSHQRTRAVAGFSEEATVMHSPECTTVPPLLLAETGHDSRAPLAAMAIGRSDVAIGIVGPWM
jgi:hypothetical protein